MNFTPSEDQKPVADVPYFEDSRADLTPYYGSRKTVSEAIKEVEAELEKLGGRVTNWIEGKFDDGKNKRIGYQINISYKGHRGIISVAGLPLRKAGWGADARRKENKVKVQALLNVRDWLKAAVTQTMFQPGVDPLVMHMLVDGERTLYQMIQESGVREMLPPPPAVDEFVIEGEYEDD